MGGIHAIPYCSKPNGTVCCMLYGGLLGDADSRTDPGAQVGRRRPATIGKIASASDPDFSLHVTRGEQRKTIEFLIDGNSKVGRQATSRLAGHGRISLPRRQEHRSSRCRRARRGLGGAVELRGRTRQNQCNSFESANCHPPRPRKGEDSYKVWFGFSQSTFGGCLFHRSALLRRISTGYTSGLPGPRSCDKRIIQKKRAPYIPVLKNGALRRIW
jgi:hypothetical protein